MKESRLSTVPRKSGGRIKDALETSLPAHQIGKFSRRLILSIAVLVACAPACAHSMVAAHQTGEPGREQQFQLVSQGVEHLRITRGYKSETEETGPWVINLLRIDLSNLSLRIARALDEGIGVETTSSMAERHGAIAAVNGGYFRTTGTYRGEPTGALLLDGKLVSESLDGRAAVGLIQKRDRTEVIFGHLNFIGSVKTDSGARRAINGINRPRAANELVIFLPVFHRTTLTTPGGVEMIVRRGRVVRIEEGRGSAEIPPDGCVISASGAARDWAVNNLRVGSRLRMNMKLTPAESGHEGLWEQATAIVGGGPQLVKGGRIEITARAEKIGEKFVADRHPRTAIAKLKSGKILFITVDGRQPGTSAGMSLVELAALLLEFGATEAINLDGGGSTTMVIGGKIVNVPSDQTGERPVSDSFLIVPKSFNRRARMN
jgi:exopolysaccharide biosynthesis protein